MRRNSKSDAASISQVRLQNAYLGGLMDTATVKPVATKEEPGDVDLSGSETWSFQEEAVTVRPIAFSTFTRKLDASSKSDHSENPKAERIEWPHNLQISPATVHHTEAVFSIVRKIYEREQDDPADDLDVNAAIWGIFLNTTLQEVVHLGQDYEVNLRYVKNHLWNSVEQLFNETGRLIRDQTEITGVNTINFKELTWMSISLLCSRAYQITNCQNLRPLQLSALCGEHRR